MLYLKLYAQAQTNIIGKRSDWVLQSSITVRKTAGNLVARILSSSSQAVSSTSKSKFLFISFFLLIKKFTVFLRSQNRSRPNFTAKIICVTNYDRTWRVERQKSTWRSWKNQIFLLWIVNENHWARIGFKIGSKH